VKKATTISDSFERKRYISSVFSLRLANGMKLTNREQDIIEAIAHGDTNYKSIARRLEIASTTAQIHAGRTWRKLGLQSKDELIAFVNRELRPLDDSKE